MVVYPELTIMDSDIECGRDRLRREPAIGRTKRYCIRMHAPETDTALVQDTPRSAYPVAQLRFGPHLSCLVAPRLGYTS